MAKKFMSWKTKGMNRDLSVTAFNPEFAFENRNLRLSTNEYNTLMSWVNEKGTKEISLYSQYYYYNKETKETVYTQPEDYNKKVLLWQKVDVTPPYWRNIETGATMDTEPSNNPLVDKWEWHYTSTVLDGTPIGTAIINHKLIVFTTKTTVRKTGEKDNEPVYTTTKLDCIYSLQYVDIAKECLLCTKLFGKNSLDLGFDVEHPIETLSSYESENIQKVYWTDGLNQPRVINVVGTILQDDASQFDFVPELDLEEDITVEKLLGANGTFAPGVIQYAFTYYRKNGQETNVFYTTPLYYISYKDRGASPEDKVENAFKIKVVKVDTHFDYLRIYSIQRTSINGTPICKRIQDIEISSLKEIIIEGQSDPVKVADYIDTGTSGDSVDPTELLYKGGETIAAQTIEQKDGTLFLGNISIERNMLKEMSIDGQKFDVAVQNAVELDQAATRKLKLSASSTESYEYANQLTAYDNATGHISLPCGGFKRGDKYRLGLQFQHKSGKWSEPVYIGDEAPTSYPGYASNILTLPVFKASINVDTHSSLLNALKSAGYLKLRPVVVFPSIKDRYTVCQGVVNPTMWTSNHRNIDKDLYAQSSWFFRFTNGGKWDSNNGSVSPTSNGNLPYAHKGIGGQGGGTKYNPGTSAETGNIRQVEIQGEFTAAGNNQFQIDRGFQTFHSPDVEFDDQLLNMDFNSVKYRQVGYAYNINTMSDIDLQTVTPTISNDGTGFIHKSFNHSKSYGIVSGLFYDDYVVEDWAEYNEEKNVITSLKTQKASAKWMVYLWNKNGALNNDINRPAGKGNMTSELKKKVVSNLRFADSTFENDGTFDPTSIRSFTSQPQVFISDQTTILKFGSEIYKGNIDTMLVPDESDGQYFAFNNAKFEQDVQSQTPFNNNTWWKTYSLNASQDDEAGLYKYYASKPWERPDGDSTSVGNQYIDIVMKKDGVRMKYKSTAHLVFKAGGIYWKEPSSGDALLPIVEITQTPTDIFGGTSKDAFKENVWLPCGEPVRLDNYTNDTLQFEYSYGDTYYQRWDCLKTYPFTREDPNQVVEIGSFMLETHTNIDGRYDRNRGQMNNLNMTPQNFNLLNPVYSQVDNFFTYRIMDEDYYKDVDFPNQVTWSKTKENGADIDLWTNITLASTLELDGDKGAISKITRYNDQLICFQDSGISQILYNENAQLSTTQGVPVEIGNSGKVDGKRYLSGTVGCSNKWSMATTPAGIYFMDSNEKSIYLFSQGLQNLSTIGGFNTYCKWCIPSSKVKWNPSFPKMGEKYSAFATFYDRMNQDIMFVGNATTLAYSEKLNAFTSFYDYQGASFFNNLDDTGIWIYGNKLWKHQAGEYCRFFGVNRPYSMILIANAEPQLSKMFTNLEFRASVDNDMWYDEVTQKYYPFLPFDSIEVWDEYQHGIGYLKDGKDVRPSQHHKLDNTANINRKFRIWRTDVPRDNATDADVFDETFDRTFHILSRIKKHPNDRMLNPWLYIRLRKEAAHDEMTTQVTIYENLNRTEIQDIMMTYYG